MSGRGASSGISSRNASTPEYKEAYRTEMENAHDFPAAFAIESNATKATIGYQMYVHQDVTGRSLIADTRKDVDYLKKRLNRLIKSARLMVCLKPPSTA